jgi:demethylmenaquinone methyltransferase/2-methoxy-6-polyprenyl-1,4-benzoquinol methylase
VPLASKLTVRQHLGDNTQEDSPLPPPERKAIYVQEMFGRIARRYDLMNRLMTLGRDRAWRRYTVARLELNSPAQDPGQGPAQPGIVLDVATGTGDLAFEVLHQQPDARVVGLDFVPDMLALAQHKASGTPQEDPAGTGPRSGIQNAKPLALIAADALQIPCPNGTFDAVVTGFALRNVTDIPAAFAEMARVTRPGGRIACLEIARPQAPLFRPLFALYFYRLVPIMGGWITGQRSAYTYLPHSLTGLLAPDEIEDVMRRTGWYDVSHQRLMMGTVAVHVGVRERADART